MITAPVYVSIQLVWWEPSSQDPAAQPLSCDIAARISSQCPSASSSWHWRHCFHGFIVVGTHRGRWDDAQVCLHRLQQMLSVLHRHPYSYTHTLQRLNIPPTPPNSEFLKLGFTQHLSSLHKVLLVLFLGDHFAYTEYIYIGKLLTLLLLM